MTDTPVLRLTGITKRFGSLLANDGISLELARGEVLALLGENGAGKSTLVSILFGHYVADSGMVEAFGAPLSPGDPAAALAAGIGMVHQHFTLADNLSVLDNVMIGVEPWWRPVSRRAAARAKLVDLARRFGLAVDPDARVGDLSIGEKQRVEILKALYRDARILILDEPTAVLTPQESERLFETLRAFVAAGLSIVFISHKLGEVLAVSHRIAVLRQGRLEATLPAAGTDATRLAQLMVGRAVERTTRAGREHAASAGVPAAVGGTRASGDGASGAAAVLSLRDVELLEGGRRLLERVSLELRASEIVAIAGVAGNGQQPFAELLCGLRAPSAGTLRIDGAPIAATPAAFVAARVGRIPEDRHHLGAIAESSVAENAVAEHYREPPYARGRWRVDRVAIREAAQRIVADFDVRCRGLDQPTRQLSGGNMQKLILGRVLSRSPRLIVADQPTWGLDVGAVAWIHGKLLDAARAGAAIVLISEELDEILALADRIAVISHGRLSEARPVADWSTETLGLAMMGAGAHGEGDAARAA
ncbi:MAG: ABC transporter ATP-binding protein [Burkholderiaceae bacterium]|nr:ABC transporter ATP-binding protein [Burkholderiales bacterium]MCZ8337843.1 ABC transporter ATP-binding protein [Burkholderiaceae bacterium]